MRTLKIYQSKDSLQFLLSGLKRDNLFEADSEKVNDLAVWYALIREDGAGGYVDPRTLSDRIVSSLLPLVAYLFRKYGLGQPLFDDAMSRTIENIYRALGAYDPIKFPESKFSSYIKLYILNAVEQERAQRRVVVIPKKIRYKTLRKERDHWLSNAERRHTFRQFELSRGHEIWDTTVNEDVRIEWDDYNDVPDFISELHNEDNLNEAITLTEILDSLGKVLGPKEYLVFCHSFGIHGYQYKTLKELSEIFHEEGWKASKEWIWQLKARALKRVREYAEKSLMDEAC